MSFDPQNPRGAPRPTPPPTNKPASGYIPPQPQRTGVEPRFILAAIAAVVLLIVALALVFVISHPGDGVATPIPTAGTGASNLPSNPPPSSRSSTSAATPSAVAGTSAPPPTPVASFVAPSAGTPEAALLAHVPEALRATCATAAGSGGILVTASCTADAGAITVTYDQYGDATSMDAAYTVLTSHAQIDPDSGSCEDHGTWPAEGSYQVENEPGGRRLCTDQPGSSTIYWTDDRLTILSTAASTTGDYAALIQFWTNEAGPIP